MRQAAVGFQCPSCVNEGARSTRSGQATYGGKVSANPALTSQILIALNAAVWILIMVTGGPGSQWVDRLAIRPDGGLTQAQDGSFVAFPIGVNDGAWWQPVTSIFTHIEIWHIGFNMLALWLFGPQLESVLGRTRFLALYLLSGLFGSAFVYLLTAPRFLQGVEFFDSTLGASGAIFGLFGGYLVIALKMRRDIRQMLILLLINAFITFTVPNVSWQGHLGGLVGGVLIGVILVYAPRQHRVAWQLAGMALLTAMVLLAFTVRTLTLA